MPAQGGSGSTGLQDVVRRNIHPLVDRGTVRSHFGVLSRDSMLIISTGLCHQPTERVDALGRRRDCAVVEKDLRDVTDIIKAEHPEHPGARPRS